MGGMILLFVALLGSAAGWLVGDRTTRMAALEREANRALEEAGDLQNRAKWTEALEAVKRAEGILASGGNQGVRDRVRERRKDLEMVLRLELIRLPPAVAGMDGRQNDKATDTAYAEAFREYGIDVDTLDPQEAAERIRGRSVLLELASALDHWAGTRRAISQGDDAGWKRLVAVARAADLDEWRNELRDAWEHRRIETLNKLATSAPRKDLPAQTWLLLCLFNGGMSHQVEQALLRQAQHKFPDDYWINFKLAWTLDHSPPPYSQPDEAVRYYTATVAVRPRNLPGRWYLAQALLQRGKFEEAFAEYQMCIEVQKESGGQNGKYHNVLAWHLSNCPDPKLRDPGLAIELATQAVELNRGEGSFWNTLGVAHYRAGHWKQAIAALEKAMPLHRSQHESYDMYFLAMAYWQLDEKEKAREFYDRAVRWMEKNESRNDELRGFRGEAAELLGVKEKKD